MHDIVHGRAELVLQRKIELSPAQEMWSQARRDLGNGPSFLGLELVNAANVRANENPPVGALASTTVTSSPLFLVAKSPASPVVAPNGTMTWTVDYRNVGNEDSLNTRLVDLLPANAAYFGHTNNGGPGVHDPVARTVTWNLGTVAAGASGSVASSA